MLAKRWREHDDTEAAHRLVTSHLRLVAKIAMGYRGYGLPIAELISEGNVGLMQAVKRFDPDRGFRLATYAMWWIRASIQEYILHSLVAGEDGHHGGAEEAVLQPAQAEGPDAGDRGRRPVARDRSSKIADHARRARGGSRLHEPPPRGRRTHSLNAPLSAEGDSEWQDWLVDERPEPGDRARREPRSSASRTQLLAEAMKRAQRPRAPHPDRAPPEGRADDARGPVAAIRHQPRARAPDRGARVREAAEGDEEHGGRGGHGIVQEGRSSRARLTGAQLT